MNDTFVIGMNSKISSIVLYGKLALLVALFYAGNSQAQQINIELGPDAIALNQSFTITFNITNGNIDNYSSFPDIEGLRKQGISSSSGTYNYNGRVTRINSIVMSYSALQEGTIIIPPFSMTINGEKVNSPGKKLQVGPPIKRQQRRQSIFDHDPFEDFFGKQEEPEYVDVKDDAFLAVSTSKNEVYVGEGFTVDLSFFVSDDNRAAMRFYDLNKQLSEILKDLKPDNCWEENFNIENINGEQVEIKGKSYLQYKLYEAAFFPFNTDTVEFPSTQLEMIKFLVAKNPTFFGSNRKESFKKFRSIPKKVIVKPLPPHPLRDLVAVGDYKLSENLSSERSETGQSFEYDFIVYGEGNISSVNPPLLPSNKVFDFYDPNSNQKIQRRNGRVTGSKTFSYFVVPNEPGAHFLGDYFKWVYFNPKSETYDTLSSQYHVAVHGESRKNEEIKASDMGSFYELISEEGNKEAIDSREWVKLFSNIFILGSILFAAYFILKK